MREILSCSIAVKKPLKTTANDPVRINPSLSPKPRIFLIMHHPGQSFVGIVVGTAMNKTIKVRIEKIKMHPVVQKPVKRHVNFLVHDEKEEAVNGDIVRIDSCQKISKRKAFTLGSIVKPAARYISEDGKVYSQQQDYKKDLYEKFRTNTVASMIASDKRANDLMQSKKRFL